MTDVWIILQRWNSIRTHWMLVGLEPNYHMAKELFDEAVAKYPNQQFALAKLHESSITLTLQRVDESEGDTT